MPRLRVLAGTSPTSLVPINELVNTNGSHTISSDVFEGQITVNIKGFTHPDGRVRDTEYFDREDRHGVTWSIQVQGRFLIPCSADDVLFGNTFDKPLKLPWGSSAALKFMKYVDPVLEHDLKSPTKPWALSPLVSTMPHLAHKRLHASPSCFPSPSSSSSDILLDKDEKQCDHLRTALTNAAKSSIPLPEFPPSQSIDDDISQLHFALVEESSSSGSNSLASSSTSSLSSTLSSTKSKLSTFSSKSKERKKHACTTHRFSDLQTASDRRSHFSSEVNRQAVQFGPKDLITTDFCYGFLEFSPTLSLRLPGGISFDLMRYWDGQPVRFVCCERKAHSNEESNGEDPWGRIFWCVTIELEDENE